MAKTKEEQLRHNNALQRKWYRENKERAREIARESYHRRKAKFTEEYKRERAERNKQWAKEHPEKMRAAWRRYHNRNREERNAQSREYNSKHKEHRAEYQKEWIANNREQTLVQRKKYVERHPERVKHQKKASRQRHLAKCKAKDRRDYRENRVKHILQNKEYREKKYGKKTYCHLCGWESDCLIDTGAGLELHHIIPRKDNGPDDKSNIITICSNCHRKIHNPNSDRIGKCPRCGIKNGFMEVHHINPKSRGGGDSEANLITICACCHRKAHAELSIPAVPGVN